MVVDWHGRLSHRPQWTLYYYLGNREHHTQRLEPLGAMPMSSWACLACMPTKTWAWHPAICDPFTHQVTRSWLIAKNVTQIAPGSNHAHLDTGSTSSCSAARWLVCFRRSTGQKCKSMSAGPRKFGTDSVTSPREMMNHADVQVAFPGVVLCSSTVCGGGFETNHVVTNGNNAG